MNTDTLNTIRELNDKITDGLLHIEELRARATSTAVKYDTTGGSHGSPTNKLEQIACLIDYEERRINSMIDKRYDLIRSTTRVIKRACQDPAERHVLYLRYYSGMNWPDVIDVMSKRHNVQERKVYYFHHVALAHLESYNM